jgi:hypothetical protein
MREKKDGAARLRGRRRAGVEVDLLRWIFPERRINQRMNGLFHSAADNRRVMSSMALAKPGSAESGHDGDPW